MIGRIKGILLEKEATRVLLDVNGVAYEIEVPMTTVFQLPETGEGAVLHTHLVVREDAQQLYGFFELRERELFRILIRINGVGPKLALAILSGLDAGELIQCVHDNDVEALVRLPGVGKKTAERLIIELRDKLGDWQTRDGRTEPRPALRAGGGARPNASREAEAALVSLGYKPQEAGRAVAQAAGTLSEEGRDEETEALIRLALRNMTS